MVEGVDFPLSTIASHALNELVVHGGDVARADGAPWPVDRHHAALVLQGFMFPVLGALRGAMVEQKGAAGVTATFHILLRGGGAVYLRFADGDLSVSDDPPGPVDCHLSVDPAAFLAVGVGPHHAVAADPQGQAPGLRPQAVVGPQTARDAPQRIGFRKGAAPCRVHSRSVRR